MTDRHIVPDFPQLTPDAIRRRRKALGLKPSELARVLGTTRNRVHDWERGIHVPTRPTQRMITLLPYLPRLMLYALAAGASLEDAAKRPEDVVRLY